MLVSQYDIWMINWTTRNTGNGSRVQHKHEKYEKREFVFKEPKILAMDNDYDQLWIQEIIRIENEQDLIDEKQDIKTTLIVITI